ncbi:hypothetical protein Tco_0604291 [Tanacetum coccineum]
MANTRRVWKSVRYDVSKELGTAYWGFLGVGTTFDIFQNIHILYFQYGVLASSGYRVLIFIPLWSLVSACTDTLEIKKVNEKVYAAQVGYGLCNGPHYTKDCPLKEEGKTLKEAYYTQFGVPFPQAGRQTMEESLSKFIVESAKRHDENSNLIKEIRASMDAVIRNQGASIKALGIQIGKMNKVLKERGSGSLQSSTETNPRDHVKSISTSEEAKMPSIRRIGSNRYVISTIHKIDNISLIELTHAPIPFPGRLK